MEAIRFDGHMIWMFIWSEIFFMRFDAVFEDIH